MERQLPQGIMRMHAERAVNTSATRVDVAKVTEKINQPDVLHQTFFASKHPRVIDINALPDTSEVSLINPTGKYADVAIMAIAKGAKPHSKEPTTETVYGYPQSTQEAYWQAILGSMQMLQQSALDPNTRVLATENCITVYSNNRHRTSRTVALPHTHISAINEDRITKGHIQIPHLETERQLGDKYLSDLAERVKNNISDSVKKNVQFEVRSDLPHGYTMTMPAKLDALITDPSSLAVFMALHHEAYKEALAEKDSAFAHTMKGKPRLIPQPSYRLYLEHRTNDTLYISVSPEVVSHAGVMEAAGVVLDRSEHHPEQVSEFSLGIVQRNAARKVRRAIQRRHSPADEPKTAEYKLRQEMLKSTTI